MVLLLVIRQYEGKSYRQFSEWLVEAYYLKCFSSYHIYTTLHHSSKVCQTINGTILAKLISSFILSLTYINRLFIGIDSSGIKITNASHYYTDKAKLRKKYLKLSLSADLLSQIICTIKIRRAPTRHDNIDFQPLVIRTSEVLPISITVADKGYDSEDNHIQIKRTSICILYNTSQI